MGKPLIMGRRTHESIGRPLPGRKNIIISSDLHYQAVAGCTVVHSIQQALLECEDAPEVMVMGGASLYRQCLEAADKIYLTLVHTQLEGDTWFPDWDKSQWHEIGHETYPADEKNEYPYSFIIYQRNDRSI